MFEKNTAATPDTVQAALESTTVDMMALGFDYDSGYGLIQADQAVAAISTSAPPSNSPPTAFFTFSCNQLTCSFDASGSTDDGTIVDYSWNYGDGSSGGGMTTVHPYDAAGTYDVTLTVTDDAAATGTTTGQVQAKNKGKSSGSSDAGGGGDSGGACPPAKAAQGKC